MGLLSNKSHGQPARHDDPEAAIERYLEELRQSDVAGATPSASTLNALGDAYLDQSDVVSAIDYYRQAADVYAREGMYDNAIACCKKIRRHSPDDPSVGLLLGRYYASKGLRTDALRELVADGETQIRGENRRQAIEIFREITRIAPDRPDQREQLAGLLSDDGQREAAIVEYREAIESYQTEGDEQAAARVRQVLDDLSSAGAEEQTPESIDEQSQPPTETRLSIAPDVEIEATHYGEQVGVTPLDTEDASSASDVASQIRLAAQGLRAEGRWEEAAEAYRQLSDANTIDADDFGAWAECARQSGAAPKVLEALAAASRWHMAQDDTKSARQAAEEILLIDPQNTTAIELLERLGPGLSSI